MPFKNPEKRRAYQKAYQERYHKTYGPRYRAANAETIKSRQALWYLENKERLDTKTRVRVRSLASADALAVIHHLEGLSREQ